jgi:hypothetical protein
MASRSVSGYKGAATRASRDAQVASNIPAGQIALWNRVKGQFRGSMEQRTRGFKQYVHDHPREAHAALQAHADRKVEAMTAGRGGSRNTFRENSHAWFGRKAASAASASSSKSVRGGFVSTGSSALLPDAPF